MPSQNHSKIFFYSWCWFQFCRAGKPAQSFSYCHLTARYPVILSIENHCTVPQQKKMAKYLREVLQDKLDLSNVSVHECKKLPSPEILKGKILVKVQLFLPTHTHTYMLFRHHLTTVDSRVFLFLLYRFSVDAESFQVTSHCSYYMQSGWTSWQNTSLSW